MKSITYISILAITMLLSGCYVHHKQEDVLIKGIDIDQSLEVAELSMGENNFGTVLTIWTLRDQHLSKDNAKRVSELYFTHIDRIDSEEQKSRKFSVWHLTWAISNMYRLAQSEEVKAALETAYADAATRVHKIDRKIAVKHFYDEPPLMGDIHSGGKSYAESHLVVPGEKDYLQSSNDYVPKNSD